MDASPFDAAPRMRRSTRYGLTICGRISIARTTPARPGSTSLTGIPDGGTINVVRDDPERRGLLFAGSEQAVYVSFDDGDHWQSLRLNMPATSIRDLVIKDDDLVWQRMGDRSGSSTTSRRCGRCGPRPLRRRASLSSAAGLALPLEQEHRYAVAADEPGGENPPDGAIINYWLKRTRVAGHARNSGCFRQRPCGIIRAPIPRRHPLRGATRRTTGCGRPRRCRRKRASIVSCGMCVTSGRRCGLLLSHRRHQPQHSARALRSWVAAGLLHGAAHGERPVVDRSRSS